MINKESLKFVGIFVVVIIAALAAIYYANYYFSPEQKALRYYADLERQYREDTYGGKTPEETLQLFIDALKAGDIELASKYFVVEERGKKLEFLQKVKVAGNLESMAQDLERPKEKYSLIEGDDSRYIFDIFNDRGELSVQVDIGRGSNGVWKIIDL